jgi:tetratricopeptide (TPR) repeat protein
LRLNPVAAAVLAVLAGGCAPGESGAQRRASVPGGARVGVDAVPAVHLLENHSSSLIAWRRAGVTDRILIHMDGHSDVDWLPDASVARLAAADPDELASFELHPYALDGSTHRRFAIWNFVYPATRLGVVREFVWVVPDGTLSGPAAAGALVHELILDKISSISLDESRSLRLENGMVRGTILGIPWTVCELKDLRDPGEPVLLDIDLDYFTTRSATTQEVTASPWIEPDQVVARLRDAGIRTDVVTLSLSTMGGYLPPSCRWIGPAMVAALKRLPQASDPRWSRRALADRAAADGRDDEAIRIERDLTAEHPDDGATWYDLSRALERTGRRAEAAQASSRAIAADPLLAHAKLFEADRAYLNHDYAGALDLYRAYRRAFPEGPFVPYGLRREAGCLARTGHDDAAIATFRKALEAAPEHGDTHLDLGLLLRDHGDLDGAIAQFRAARAILPDLAAYAMALGTSLARKGRLDDAAQELESAVARRPTWAQAQANLGVLLLQAGRKEDAAAHLNAAALLAPGDPDVMRLLAELRRQGIPAGTLVAHPE